jgi:tRNA pseudouridine38-40 synthase
MTLFDQEVGRAEEPAVGARVKVRLLVAYDGSGFHGFAPNPGVRTVGGTLREALEKILRAPIELTCAGRTDTGVHAWGQVVSFDAPADGLSPQTLQRSLNRLCAPAIVVREAALAPEGFDARHSARARTYRYTIVNRPVPDPFLAHLAWHVDQRLDLDLLRLGCDPLVGTHDFTAFCRRPKRSDRDQESAEGRHQHGAEGGGPAGPSLVRDVHRAGWDDLGDGVLRFEITANAFCHQMVRSVVGTLVEVGRTRLHAGDILAILGSRDRAAAGKLAPPQGLCLWHVDYPASAGPGGISS